MAEDLREQETVTMTLKNKELALSMVSTILKLLPCVLQDVQPSATHRRSDTQHPATEGTEPSLPQRKLYPLPLLL